MVASAGAQPVPFAMMAAHILWVDIDTPIEVDYYQAGGILPFVLRQLLQA